MVWEKLISSIGKMSLSITKIESIGISIDVKSVQVQITSLQYYSEDIDLYTQLCDIRHIDQI